MATRGPQALELGHADAVAVTADVRWLHDAKLAERACLMAMSLREVEDAWRISSLAWRGARREGDVHAGCSV